jgi:SAM-dependent methyltransferase
MTTVTQDTAGTASAPSVKARQQTMWAPGDFAVIGTTLQIVGELLCEAIDLRSTEHVLDVAAGNGNATLAAARHFASVTSTDYVPALLERGRERARAEGLEVTFETADAEALPYRRELRRRAVHLRRDVRARSRQGRRGDASGVPARRPYRPGVVDAAGLPRRPLTNGRQARAADTRRSFAAALGNT